MCVQLLVLWASYWPNKDESLVLAKVTSTFYSSGEQQHLVVNLIGPFPLNVWYYCVFIPYSKDQLPCTWLEDGKWNYTSLYIFILIQLLGEFYDKYFNGYTYFHQSIRSLRVLSKPMLPLHLTLNIRGAKACIVHPSHSRALKGMRFSLYTPVHYLCAGSGIGFVYILRERH